MAVNPGNMIDPTIEALSAYFASKAALSAIKPPAGAALYTTTRTALVQETLSVLIHARTIRPDQPLARAIPDSR